MAVILIIEDDDDLREGLSFSFRGEGYGTDTASTVREGLRRLKEKKYDGILLDCNLPDGSGFSLCEKIRAADDTPILMLTARDTELDEVKALELGADDFMSKPFSIAVLKTRMKKLLSRKERSPWLSSNGIRVSTGTCTAFSRDEEIALSKVEYKLLVLFLENKNQILSREQILLHIWDSEGKFVDENTVSVNIRRLRQKIEKDPASPSCIRTVHGLGYVWKEL